MDSRSPDCCTLPFAHFKADPSMHESRNEPSMLTSLLLDVCCIRDLSNVLHVAGSIPSGRASFASPSLTNAPDQYENLSLHDASEIYLMISKHHSQTRNAAL